MNSRFARDDGDSSSEDRMREELHAARTVRGRVEERLQKPAESPVEEVLELLEDGYARALHVEGECRELARELAELRVDATDPEGVERLRLELREARSELRRLRGALSTLRRWVEENS